MNPNHLNEKTRKEIDEIEVTPKTTWKEFERKVFGVIAKNLEEEQSNDKED